MPVKAKQPQTEDKKVIRYNAIEVRVSPAEEAAKLQFQLQKLAREMVSSLSVLEPAQSKALVDSFVSELVVSIANQERYEIRRQKQAKGIAAAKAKGVHFGPRPRALPDGFEELRRAWRNKEISLRAAAERCGVPKSTFRDAALRAETAASRAGVTAGQF